ncbi:uncharacterized protein METZ01_LOCUS444903, partial [marine metagenome]
GGRRGGGDRRARREVGRDHQGAGGARRRPRWARRSSRRRTGANRSLQGEAGPLQVPHVGRVPRRVGPYRHRQAPEVQAARPLLGRHGQTGEL